MCILMSYANRSLLFCGREESLARINAMNKETPFCTVTGEGRPHVHIHTEHVIIQL